MPVTPKFYLSQTDEFVILKVRVPYVRVSNMEFTIDGAAFSFHCKPYLLRLVFPAPLVDDERAHGTYDHSDENGTITLRLPKEEKGKHFMDLDLLTTLTQPRNRTALINQKPVMNPIEVVSTSEMGESRGKNESGMREEAAKDLSVKVLDSSTTSSSTTIEPQMQGESDLKPLSSAAKKPKQLIQVLEDSDLGSEAKPDEVLSKTAQVESMHTESRGVEGANALNGGIKKFYSNALLELEEMIGEETTQESIVKSFLNAQLPEAEAVSGPTHSGKDLDDISNQLQSVDLKLDSVPTYGFNGCMKNFFSSIQNDFPELVALENPDSVENERRSSLRIAKENLDFDEDRFLGDLFGANEDPIYLGALQFLPTYVHLSNEENLIFNDEEREQMVSLPNKEFLAFSDEETHRCLVSIFDVILASIYDHRITQGEPNVESAWTIRTLSATLSWLEEFKTVGDSIKSFAHRVLVYPYMRHCDVTLKVLQDVCTVFQGGKRFILRILLQTHRVFHKSDTFYLLNRLYLTDMCVWIQKLQDSSIDKFAVEVVQAAQMFSVGDDIRWDLGSLIQEAFSRTS